MQRKRSRPPVLQTSTASLTYDACFAHLYINHLFFTSEPGSCRLSNLPLTAKLFSPQLTAFQIVFFVPSPLQGLLDECFCVLYFILVY